MNLCHRLSPKGEWGPLATLEFRTPASAPGAAPAKPGIELTHTEYELTGNNLVTESLTNLAPRRFP